MRVTGIDHLVLTVTDIERTSDFYSRVLGMEAITFGEGRKALAFGDQKINLHQVENGHPPVAARPVPGSADICFLTDLSLKDLACALTGAGVEIIEGPATRHGARGRIRSLYFRDPDGNLIEIATSVEARKRPRRKVLNFVL